MTRLFLLLTLAVGLLLGAAPRPKRPNLILVSMDTTRADALSCDGRPPGFRHDLPQTTPNLDALASDGIRFAKFYAHAPSTLNSHTSMMTGLDPHEHGVPRNGFPLDPQTHTLAERLHDQGYDTLAVVGAAALDHTMGLSRGFRVYDDKMPGKKALMYQDDAKGVVDRALAAVDGRAPDAPLFLFVHFYDAHAPYEPPPPFDRKFQDPGYHGQPGDLASLRTELLLGWAPSADVESVVASYQGEVAYVDDQLGGLVDGLNHRKLLDHALLVVTADHGEVLSERPAFAWSHGSDVSEGAMHVPLIVRGYGVAVGAHRVVHRQAEMSALAPTLELALGLSADLGGNSFWNLIRPGPIRDVEGWPDTPVRTIFSEATRPRSQESTDDWNNLPFERGVRAGGAAMYGTPALNEAYAMEDGDPAMLPVLRPMIARWDEGRPGHREMDAAATQEALRALGYVDSPEDKRAFPATSP